MSNHLKPEKVKALHEAFEENTALRAAAEKAQCSKRTAELYFDKWRREALSEGHRSVIGEGRPEATASKGAETTTGQPAEIFGASAPAPHFLHLKTSDILRRGPRYFEAIPLDQGRHWRAEDEAAIIVLARSETKIETAAAIVARKPSAIAWRCQDFGWYCPLAWRRIAQPKNAFAPREPRPQLEYPYIIGEARDDHAFLLAVNKIVPRGLPGDLRNDVCQDMLLAILEGELSVDDIEAEMPKYLKAARKRYQLPWGTVNIDAPLWDDGRPLSEMISENPLYR